MKYRKLGRTGVEVSEVCLGTEGLGEKDAQTVKATFRLAVDSGINFIDCPAWWPEFQNAAGAALDGIRGEVMLSAHFGEQLPRTREARSRPVHLHLVELLKNARSRTVRSILQRAASRECTPSTSTSCS